MDTMLTSLDQYLMTCDHLTDYIFNVWEHINRNSVALKLLFISQMLSFITNESMERLSLVTVIFLRMSPWVGGACDNN